MKQSTSRVTVPERGVFPLNTSLLERLFSRLLNSHRYSHAPEFLKTLQGKSPAYIKMASRFADGKSRVKREELSGKLRELLDSKDAFDLIPFTEHEALERVRTELIALRDVK